jgi:hypothetical protein
MALLAADWGVGQVLWSLLWFFLFVIWIALAIAVFVDIFRSRDMGGWAKAIWLIVVLLLPYLGVFVYLVVRGGRMGQRAADDAQAREDAFREYVQGVAGPSGASTADELVKLAALRDQGQLTDDEYNRARAKAIG